MVTVYQTTYALLPISLLGSFINWIVLFAFMKLQSFNHSFGYLSANQAIADALHPTMFLLYFCPMVLFDSSTMRDFSSYCGLMIILSYEISVMSHLAISLNRLCAVWAPYKYKSIFSGTNTKLFILGIWILTGSIDVLLYFILCKFYYENNTLFLTFTNSALCGSVAWYGDFIKNSAIVAIIMMLDVLTVVKFRRKSKKVTARISDIAQARSTARENRFIKQTVIQGSGFMLELLTYFFIPTYFPQNEWAIFFGTSFAWVAIHAMDGWV